MANHTKLIAKNGSEYQIADCCAPIHDISGSVTGAVLVFRDVTEEYHRREALRESEEKYYALFNQSTEGIYLHDVEGRILDVNDVACEQSGYSKEEWLGLTVFDGHPDQSTKNPPRAEILRIWRQWVPEQRFTVEADHQRKDGTVYPVEISTGMVRYGNTNAMLAIVKDITERKLAEQALQKSVEEKNVLLSEIHHRVKNNMAVISSLLTLQSEFSEQKKDPEKLLKDLQTRILSMAWVHELVYESKDFAQIQSVKLLQRLADYLKNSYQPDDKEITLQVRTEDIMLDMNNSVPLTLLIAEVLTNAWKHAFTGRRTGRIEVMLNKDNEGFRMIVRDDGVGVADLEKLRQPESFGYTIVHGLARQLRGELSFSSPAEGGLQVEAWFPDKMTTKVP